MIFFFFVKLGKKNCERLCFLNREIVQHRDRKNYILTIIIKREMRVIRSILKNNVFFENNDKNRVV